LRVVAAVDNTQQAVEALVDCAQLSPQQAEVAL
jgi:hypothetical protein